ncbi:MAG: (2Fe-2S)-binding protein [Nitrospirota bacterium]
MYICLCKGITDSQVRSLGRSGVVSPEALTAELGIDRNDCCGRCVAGIPRLVAIAREALADTDFVAPTNSVSRS